MAGGVVVRGAEALKLALNKFDFDLDRAVDEAVLAMAFTVQSTAVKSIAQKSNSGRFVSRGKKRHEISAVGEAPNTDTGRLMGSVQVSHVPKAKIALVGTNLDYGAILETSLNRPWLVPALNEKIPEFGSRMKEAINRQIVKAKK